MSPLPTWLHGGVVAIGGALGYPSFRLQEEVAAIAHHFHWPLSDILELDHLTRRQWVKLALRSQTDASELIAPTQLGAP